MANENDENAPKWNFLHLAFASLTVFSVANFSVEPYLIYANGGSTAYCIAYYVMLLLTVPPLVFAQMKLGGATGQGLVGMFAKHIPILTGVGFAQIFTCLLTVFYLAPYTTYFLYYMAATVVPGAWGTGGHDGKYPWSTCSNRWNTPECKEFGIPTNASSEEEFYSYQKRLSPESDFFRRHLMPYDDPTSVALGGLDYPLPVCLLVLWIIVSLMTVFGTKMFGWLLSVLGCVTIVVLLTVIINGYVQVPAEQIREISPFFYDFSISGYHLMRPRLWVNVTIRHVYSLNLLLAFLPAIGKYFGHGAVKTNISWIFMALAVLIKPHLALNAVIPYLAVLPFAYQVPVSDVMASGPQFMFEVLPAAFSEAHYLPAAILFLIYMTCVLFSIAFLSMAVIVITDAIKEVFPALKGRLLYRVILTSALCLLSFLLGLPIVTRNGQALFHTIDFFMHALGCILVVFTAVGLAITYVKQSEFNIVGRIIVVVWLGVCSAILTGMVIAYTVENYNMETLEQIFPLKSYRTIGWLTACAPIVIGLPLGILYAFLKSTGTFGERIQYMFCGEPSTSRSDYRHEPMPMDQVGYPRQVYAYEHPEAAGEKTKL